MKREDSRLQVLVLVILLLVFHFLTGWEFLIVISIVTGIIGILSAKFSRMTGSCMGMLTKITGTIVQILLLTVIYFFILFPVAVIYRIFKSDTLMLKDKYNSHFTDVSADCDPGRFEKPW